MSKDIRTFAAMQLSEQTITDCNLLPSRQSKASVFDLFNFSRTSGGEEALQKMLRTRLESVAAIVEVQDAIRFASDHLQELDLKIINAELHYINEYFRVNNNKTGEKIGVLHRLRYRYTDDADYSYTRSNVVRIIIFLQGIGKQISHNTDEYPKFLQKPIQRIREIFSDPGYLLHIDPAINNQQVSRIITTDYFLRMQFRVLFDEIMDNIYQVEAIVSIAKASRRHQLVFPEFSDHNDFILKDCYHLLIHDPIKNDLMIEKEKNLLFLTGANMAGKSSFLRSVGTILCLSHAGLPVPASIARLPFYDEISVNISVQDNLLKGYSHFYNELQVVNNFLLQLAAGKRCFAIFDEVFNGTNLNDAVSCAAILLEALKSYRESLAFISSHNIQMAGNGTDNMQFNHIESRLENGHPVFTYKLQPGKNETALGLILFQQMRQSQQIKP